MLDDVTFDTTNDKLKWGGIFATIGVAIGTTCLLLRCLCLKCCKENSPRKPKIKRLYINRSKQKYVNDDDEVINSVKRGKVDIATDTEGLEEGGMSSII